ncbi:uncharacterized protein LOC131207791 [Anopheles bellator]|uniref:uncharacterized protein LOC131207791 n=1 Tax=Anopheles bellator TaxID=139047 RepID=UPI0026486056|nr:uncharacterized protein LOC131207791 [Anopheles bellator]
MAAARPTKPSKLCRRTFFLQTATAPTRSEMRSELGNDLADVILATLEPNQRAAVPADRVVVTEDAPVAPAAVGHDAEQVRDQIHEHILNIGGHVSKRMEGYWRHRLKEVASAAVGADDVDFLRFECKQKIAIARDEERQRYERLAQETEEALRSRFTEEKGELHRSYAEARALWARFVCRKVRAQAKKLLCDIAAHYRVHVEREVNRRLEVERTQIRAEMEEVVRAAVEQQQRTDERAMEWLIYQYEELLKFTNEYQACMETVAIVREVCNQQASVNGLNNFPSELFNNLAIEWKKLDQKPRSVSRDVQYHCEAISDLENDVVEDKKISRESLESGPSYRESFDATVALSDIQHQRQSASLYQRPTEEHCFGELFDPTISEDRIEDFVDSILPRYIRATDEDFVAMFEKQNEE